MHRIISALVLVLMTGCSSMTPTQQTEASFVIYDVTPTTLNSSQLLEAITQAVQKNQSKVSVTRDIQTGELPAKLPRFTLKDPFANSNMGALMAAQGQTFKRPLCENSILTLGSGNNSAGSSTSFFLCVMPYQAGYSINIYSTFSSTSGGLSVDALGAALAKSVVGDASQYIPRAMNDVRLAAEGLGGKVTVIDSYIPESFKGAFAGQDGNFKK
jgi:hypothetical protein